MTRFGLRRRKLAHAVMDRGSMLALHAVFRRKPRLARAVSAVRGRAQAASTEQVERCP